MPFGSPTTTVHLCGLAFWFMYSPLRYDPDRKGIIFPYFQWEKTFWSFFRNSSSNMFFQFTLSRRAKQSMVSCMFLVQKSMQSKSNQNKIPLLPDFPGSPPLEHRRHHKNKWSKKQDKKCNGDGVWSMPFFSLAKALLYSIIRTI